PPSWPRWRNLPLPAVRARPWADGARAWTHGARPWTHPLRSSWAAGRPMSEHEVNIAAPPAVLPGPEAPTGRSRRARQILARVPEWAVLVIVLGALVAFF